MSPIVQKFQGIENFHLNLNHHVTQIQLWTHQGKNIQLKTEHQIDLSLMLYIEMPFVFTLNS